MMTTPGDKIEQIGDAIQSLMPEEIEALNRYMDHFDFDWKIIPSRALTARQSPLILPTQRE